MYRVYNTKSVQKFLFCSEKQVLETLTEQNWETFFMKRSKKDKIWNALYILIPCLGGNKVKIATTGLSIELKCETYMVEMTFGKTAIYIVGV